MENKIPEPTVYRLCTILRLLENLLSKNMNTVSSSLIGDSLNIASHTVRKDISYLVAKNKDKSKSCGYDTKKLIGIIRNSLNLDKSRNTCIVGLGKVGMAILNYERFKEYGYNIVAGFDSNSNIVETVKTTIKVYPSYEMEDYIKIAKISIGIITVPAMEAQKVANKLIACGVRGIINFAPVIIRIRNNNVFIKNIDFTNELNFVSAML